MAYTRLVGFLCDIPEDNPGNDEKSIFMLAFAYDLEKNSLEKSEHYEVPSSPYPSSNNEGLQSTVRNIEELLSESNDRGKVNNSCLCTFGPWHLRMVLHPLSFRQKVNLSESFYAYFDLKNVFKQFFGSTPTDQAIQGSLKYILEKSDLVKECGTQVLKEITILLGKMIEEGFVFEEPEHIMRFYQPNPWKGEINDEKVVKVRGLPWNSTESDVANFFIGLNVEMGGVAFCMTAQGKKNGEAVISFESKEHRCLALKRHKHYLGSRYIEVFRSTGKEFVQCLASSSKEAKALLMQKYDYIDPVIIRMRGLPYTCCQSEIVDFFKAPPNACEVLDGEEGVLLIHQSEGKSTGDAFVLFANEDEAAKALTKHKLCIGSRYIELFKSAISEIQQILIKHIDPRSPSAQKICNQSIFSQPNSPNSSSVQFESVPHCLHRNENTSKDCVRFSGLPSGTSVNDLVFFLSDHVKDIRHKGIHLVYDIKGFQTGEAFIEMVGEKQAEYLQDNRDKKLILVNGNRHQIRVEICSVDEMATLLHGIKDYPPVPVPMAHAIEPCIEKQCCSHRFIQPDNLRTDPLLDLSSVCFTTHPPLQIFTIIPNGMTSPSLMFGYPSVTSFDKAFEAKIR